MAGSLNKVMLIGNVGADPIIRQTQDGKKIATLSLATTDSWKDKATPKTPKPRRIETSNAHLHRRCQSS